MLGFLRALFDTLFDLMAATFTTFHGWGAPWWLSIIMLTVVVRTFLFPLTVRQVKSVCASYSSSSRKWTRSGTRTRKIPHLLIYGLPRSGKQAAP